MELLKELKREKIKILVDDKNNPQDFNFFDMRDNATYTLEDLLGARITIKDWHLEPCSWDNDMHDLVLYSENGNEYKINLFNLRHKITAKKVETTLTKLFDEFVESSDVRCIGEEMSVNEKKQNVTDTLMEQYRWWYFKKGSDGKFYFHSDCRDEENCADDFETAVIKYLNERERRALYDVRMDISHGGCPDPEPRKSLNRDY